MVAKSVDTAACKVAPGQAQLCVLDARHRRGFGALQCLRAVAAINESHSDEGNGCPDDYHDGADEQDDGKECLTVAMVHLFNYTSSAAIRIPLTIPFSFCNHSCKELP